MNTASVESESVVFQGQLCFPLIGSKNLALHAIEAGDALDILWVLRSELGVILDKNEDDETWKLPRQRIMPNPSLPREVGNSRRKPSVLVLASDIIGPFYAEDDDSDSLQVIIAIVAGWEIEMLRHREIRFTSVVDAFAYVDCLSRLCLNEYLLSIEASKRATRSGNAEH